MIPSIKDNPNGLHARYQIRKADGSECDPRAVYFVLRLDGFGNDKGHIFACRQAARVYAKHAPEWMRQVSEELEQLLNHFDQGQL